VVTHHESAVVINNRKGRLESLRYVAGIAPHSAWLGGQRVILAEPPAQAPLGSAKKHPHRPDARLGLMTRLRQLAPGSDLARFGG
jgi:hypothetical protein